MFASFFRARMPAGSCARKLFRPRVELLEGRLLPSIDPFQGQKIQGAEHQDDPESLVTNQSGGLDLVFVIDTTGSMWDDIDAVKVQAKKIINDIRSVQQDFRLGIVLYKDFGDVYVTHTQLAFTGQADDVIAAIQSITVAGGGDTPEAVYSGLVHAIDNQDGLGAWRDGDVHRAIILMGDAPPHDPEPTTDYTAATITQMIHDKGVQVTTVGIGDDTQARGDFHAIAEAGSGTFISAAAATDVVPALSAAIYAIGHVVRTGPDRPTLFVRSVYRDLLHRDGETAGVDYWTGLMTHGASRADVIEGFQASAEYRTNLVQNHYKTFLGRDGEGSGQDYWVHFLGAGHSVEEAKAGFLASDEYVRMHAPNTSGGGFLAAIYEDVLGRPIDVGGMIYWDNLMESGRSSRHDIAMAILSAKESRQVFLQSLYQQYLHRAPDDGGLGYFSQRMTEGMHAQDVVRDIIASDEYFSRL